VSPYLESASKLDSLGVLEETGVSAPSYRTLLRRLPVYAKDSWRQQGIVVTTFSSCFKAAPPGPLAPPTRRTASTHARLPFRRRTRRSGWRDMRNPGGRH
jgi:hypothetical protein